MAVKAYLQVTMVIPEKNRAAAAKVYTDLKNHPRCRNQGSFNSGRRCPSSSWL